MKECSLPTVSNFSALKNKSKIQITCLGQENVCTIFIAMWFSEVSHLPLSTVYMSCMEVEGLELCTTVGAVTLVSERIVVYFPGLNFNLLGPADDVMVLHYWTPMWSSVV